jgi:hypothetical protein
MADSSQAAYDKAVSQANSQAQSIKNQRAKEKEAADKKKKIAQNITTIEIVTRTKLAPAKLELANAEKAMKPLKDAYVAYYNAHKNDPGFNPATNTTLLGINTQLSPLTSQYNIAQTQIKNAQSIIDAIKAENAKLQNTNNSSSTANTPPKPSSSSAGPTKDAPKGEKIKFSKDYKYNAPMVSEAYFGSQSLENTILDGNLVDAGKYGDARDAWKGTTGGRGTLQMDKKFLSAFTSSSQENTKFKIDKQKYGFKFLYNPQTVQMAWGLLNYMSPPYEAMAQDAFQVVSAGLMPSVVTFEILLNRIKDFDYVNENGLSGGNISQFTDTTTLAGIAAASTAKNPYPENVEVEDLKEIWAKGTMYDLEYFFKTINGPDGTFTSMLNGKTADRGWLRPTIVELHLGTSLRYRVRISEFSVNHIMFNPRMVPILSSVKLTCNRFADGPDTEYYGPSNINSAGGTTSPGKSLPELRNTVPGYGR